jgi:hypothetical protein
MIDTDDIDDLVEALRATGWDRPTTTTALAAEDRAAAVALFGATNAARMASAPRGGRVKLVRTHEVYCVRNSRGWLVGAIEGKRNRVLYEALTSAECARVIQFARQRGYRVVEYDNPSPPRSEGGYVSPRPERPVPATARRPPSTPSAHAKPSKRLDILQQVARFRA